MKIVRRIIKQLLLSLLIIVPLLSSGQEKTDTTKKDIKFFVGLDANTSFVLKNKSKFNGLRLGVQINGRHRIGIGSYSMRSPLILKRTLDENSYPNNNGELKFNYNYTTLFYEYLWFKTKRWELATPVQWGSGEVKVTYRDTVQKKDSIYFSGKSRVVVTSFTAQYKLTRWLGVGSGVGYRFAIARDKRVVEGLSAPLYTFRVKIFLGELLKMWFKKDYHNEDWD